jgi:hypothetical protein
MAAKKSGRSYADMIGAIVDLARFDRRHRDRVRSMA